MGVRRIVSFVTFCLFLVGIALCGSLYGQQGTATLSGQVTDPTGAAVPGAAVSVVDTTTGTVQKTSTDSTGYFRVAALNAGTPYTLKVSAQGFKAYSTTDIVLHVGQTVAINPKLELGAVSQTVEVSATALHLQTQSADVSHSVTGTEVANIPVNGSNFTTLLTLVPGASGNLPDFNAPVPVNSSQVVSFNGTRQQHNRFLIDGMENNDRGCGGCITVLPNKETFQEFTVDTASSSAHVGQGSGGTISIALKRGGSTYHGELYEFFRNDALDATNFFANRAGQSKPELRFNNWGYQLGGFVPGSHWLRHHAYFFFDQDWNKLRQGTTIVANAVPQVEAGGNFSSMLTGQTDGNGNDTGAIFVPQPINSTQAAQFTAAGLTPGQPFPGNIIPTSVIDSNASLLGATASGPIPFPNTSGNRYTASFANPTDTRTETLRVDVDASENVRLMGHFIALSVDQVTPTSLWTNSSYPTVGTDFVNPAKSAIIKATWTMNPTTVMETSFGWDGNVIHLTPTGNFQNPAGVTNVGGIFPGNALNRRTGIQFQGSLGTALNVGSWPWDNSNDNYQLQWQLTKVAGSHTLTFGQLGMLSNKNQVIFGNTQGLFSFNGNATAAPGSPVNGSAGSDYADFLLGNAFSYEELALQDKGHARWWAYSFWFHDNWHVNDRLSIQYGVRWEYIPHVYDQHNRQSNFIPGDFNFANAQSPNPTTGQLDPNGPGFTLPPPQSGLPLVLPGFKMYTNGIRVAGSGIDRGMVKNYYNSFGPRVGFAYKLSDKLVARAGYGTFFERTQGNDVYNGWPNPPFSFDTTFFTVPLTGTAPAGGAIPIFPANVTALDFNYLIPYTSTANAMLEYQLSPKIILQAGYVGTFGRDLRIQRNVNQPLDNNPLRGVENPNQIRPFPGYAGLTYGENSVSSAYHSGQLSLRTTDWHGLTTAVAYTYSHAIDFGTGGGQSDFTTIADAYNIGAERGNSALNRTHVLTVSYVYNLPFFRNATSRAQRLLLGGWQYSGIAIAQTGLPVTIGNPGDPAGIGSGVRANCLATSSNGPQSIDEWFNTAAFAPVDPVGVNGSSGFGNCGVNTVYGPGRINFDMSFGKTFSGIPLPLSKEGGALDFKAEMFNTFNHTQPQGLNTTVTNPSFGQVTSVHDPRVIQFSMRFRF
ncbi:MAG: carboxypeptidase-like regulatory domain-containing protein [Acidobacteriota bacterium]